MRSDILTKYANKWVALTLDREKVLTSASSIKELDKKVNEKYKKIDLVYSHVLFPKSSFSP